MTECKFKVGDIVTGIVGNPGGYINCTEAATMEVIRSSSITHVDVKMINHDTKKDIIGNNFYPNVKHLKLKGKVENREMYVVFRSNGVPRIFYSYEEAFKERPKGEEVLVYKLVPHAKIKEVTKIIKFKRKKK